MKFTVPFYKIITLIAYIGTNAIIWIQPPTSNVAFTLVIITSIFIGIVVSQGPDNEI